MYHYVHTAASITWSSCVSQLCWLRVDEVLHAMGVGRNRVVWGKFVQTATLIQMYASKHASVTPAQLTQARCGL